MSRRGGGRRRRRAERAYRRLVRLYPAAHRHAFGEQMVQAFGDHYGDAVQGRGDNRLLFWLAVLADTGSSLLTEHAAEARVRLRHLPAAAKRRPDRPTRTEDGPSSGTRRRGTRVARRLHYRRPHYRRDGNRLARRLRLRWPGKRAFRVMLRTRHHRLVYRGRLAVLLAVAVLTGAALGTGTVTGRPGPGALLAGLFLAVWLASSLRLTRPVPAGRYRHGPESPGGASVREPRRPLPLSPTGSTARPLPDEPGPPIALN